MKAPNYFITILSSAAYVRYKVISQNIQYKLTKKAEKEAAIDATAVNKQTEKGEKHSSSSSHQRFVTFERKELSSSETEIAL